jgi:co-chaperonin GroES (HSP10)
MITIKGHRLLLKVEKLQEVDEVYRSAHRAGIVIAEDHEEHRRAKASLDKGTVISIGPDAWKAFHNNSNLNGEEFVPWCKVGDFIAFAKYSGKMLEDPEDKQQYIVINDEDVVAVLGGAKE